MGIASRSTGEPDREGGAGPDAGVAAGSPIPRRRPLESLEEGVYRLLRLPLFLLLVGFRRFAGR
jgi:hypothetical protein